MYVIGVCFSRTVNQSYFRLDDTCETVNDRWVCRIGILGIFNSHFVLHFVLSADKTRKLKNERTTKRHCCTSSPATCRAILISVRVNPRSLANPSNALINSFKPDFRRPTKISISRTLLPSPPLSENSTSVQ